MRVCDVSGSVRKPGVVESYACLAFVIGGVLITMMLGAPIQFGILFGTMFAALFGLRLGYTWADLERSILKRIGHLGGTMLIMWMIGFLMGTMLYSGLLPMIVYYGFEFINPKFLYFSALLVCMLMSTMTGSSWSAAGTAGVACMALAHGHGANLGIMAGAVVAGSVFGDKLSPMSETTNLAPACSGTDLYRHIKSQLWTTVPAISLAAVLFLVLGAGLDLNGGGLPEQAVVIMDQLAGLYHWSWVLLLPVIVLLVLSVLKQPAVPVMFGCGLLNLILGRFVQGFDFSIGFKTAVNGFQASYICDGVEGLALDTLDDKVLYILNRGGMTSMVSIILICFCGFALISILVHCKFLDVALAPLVHNLNSRAKTMLTAELSVLILAGLGGISYVSTVFVGEAWKKPFLKNKMGLACLSRTLEDVGTCCTSVLPWCSSAVFFASTLDVPVWGVGGYGAYTVLPFVCPVVAFVLAVFGVGMMYQESECVGITVTDVAELEGDDS